MARIPRTSLALVASLPTGLVVLCAAASHLCRLAVAAGTSVAPTADS